MINTRLYTLAKNIDGIIDDAEKNLEPDDEKKAHLAKYICVLISGFLENSVYEIYRDYAVLKKTDPYLLQFVEKKLKDVNNPDGNKLVRIANQFSTTWGKELEDFLKEDNRKGAIGSIIKNRHKIAHGDDSNITMNLIRQYWKRVLKTVEFIEGQCKEE